MSDDYVEQLGNGKFILASWVPCAEEWYALPLNEDNPVSAPMLEELAEEPGVVTFATREDAEHAARGL